MAEGREKSRGRVKAAENRLLSYSVQPWGSDARKTWFLSLSPNHSVGGRGKSSMMEEVRSCKSKISQCIQADIKAM